MTTAPLTKKSPAKRDGAKGAHSRGCEGEARSNLLAVVFLRNEEIASSSLRSSSQ